MVDEPVICYLHEYPELLNPYDPVDPECRCAEGRLAPREEKTGLAAAIEKARGGPAPVKLKGYA